MDAFDTNCLGDLPNNNHRCFITDVSLCELLKEKSESEKREQLRLILSFVEKTGSEFTFMPTNQGRYAKFERSKSERVAYYNLNTSSRDFNGMSPYA